MDNERIIDKLAIFLKEDFQGSSDYLSGINDGIYKALNHCLQRNILPVQDVREKAKEFMEKMSKEPSMLSTESLLVKFYCDLNGTAKRLHNGNDLSEKDVCVCFGTLPSLLGKNCPDCGKIVTSG